MTGARVNRWVDGGTAVAWARDYLDARRDIPYRAQGYEVVVELVAPCRVTRVLDLGTGDGYTLGLVLGLHPGATGVGVDVNPEMLRTSHDRFGGEPRAAIVVHDLDVPLPPLGRFDLVVSSFAIHHCLPDRQRALYGEVHQLLEPGGMFLNLEHVASPTPELHEAFLAALGRELEDDDPSNHLVAVETQLAWLRELGFAQVDCLWKWRELALLAAVR